MNEKGQENNHQAELEKFLDFALDDLLEFASNDAKLFEELYYNRKNQYDEFSALLEDEHMRSQNVLVIGGAGVGKTNFLYKLKLNCDSHGNFPIFLDYRRVVPKSNEGLLAYFIECIDKYFETVDRPIHTIKSNQTLDEKFQSVFSHLEKIELDGLKKHLVIFLDDLDYAEDDWFDLLHYFLPFSNSARVCLVLSVRPPLLHAIDEYDDRFRSSYIKKARPFELNKISVENVISTRLAPVLKKDEASSHKLYCSIESLFEQDSTLCKLAKTFGTTVEGIPRFEYPLTTKLTSFMQRITSGNLRETFDIAYECLMHIFRNPGILEEKDEAGVKKIIIPRGTIIQLLYKNKESRYKIFDLHSHRAKENSLFYNVLEAVKLHGKTDDRFYGALLKLGHSKKRVDEALNELSSTKRNFIIPEKFFPKKMKKHIEFSREYLSTDKAEMYLEMARDWDEYKEVFGEPGESAEKYL
jgi:hypothetical protein